MFHYYLIIITQIACLRVKLFSILFGFIWFQQKLDQLGVQNINGALFNFVVNTSFVNLFTLVDGFPDELPITMKEHKHGMYRIFNYYITKVISDV